MKVHFVKSGVAFDWDGAQECLLEAGEAAGLNLPFGCRSGNCTGCQLPLLKGEVRYIRETGAQPDPGCCLTCSCVPATDVELDG